MSVYSKVYSAGIFPYETIPDHIFRWALVKAHVEYSSSSCDHPDPVLVV